MHKHIVAQNTPILVMLVIHHLHRRESPL